MQLDDLLHCLGSVRQSRKISLFSENSNSKGLEKTPISKGHNDMKNRWFQQHMPVLVLFSVLIFATHSTAHAQRTLTSENVLSENCTPEIASLCNDVRPGQGRTIACL